MCYSLFAALFSKTFLSHPPFKYPRSAPAFPQFFRWLDISRKFLRNKKITDLAILFSEVQISNNSQSMTPQIHSKGRFH